MTVAFVGVANAGKSTLLNRLVGSRVSAVSPKAQTTREQMLGIFTENETQLIIVDTPGIIARNKVKKISREVVKASWNALDEADMICALVDSVKTISQDEKDLINGLQKYHDTRKAEGLPPKPCILLLNKFDLWEEMKSDAEKEGKQAPLPAEDRWRFHFAQLDDVFDKVIPISAKDGTRVVDAKNFIISKAPKAPWLFSPETKTPMSKLQLVTEIIREKVFRHMNNEIPFAVTQENMGWTELANGTLRIDQYLIVSKVNHKAILIGQGGKNLYAIFYEACRDIQTSLNRKVFLQLHVKYRKQAPSSAGV